MKQAKMMIAAGLLLTCTAFAGAQASQQTPYNKSKEAAQEKASGIKDAVDITSGPTFQQTGPSTGTLTWTTNKTAATNVNYGLNRSNPEQKSYQPGGSTNHTAQLKNLKPGTTYYYEIETNKGKDRFKGHFQTTGASTGSTDANGGHGTTTAQEAASGIKDDVDIVGQPQFSQTSASAGTLTWTTNKQAATRVRYGTDQNNPSQRAYQAGGSTNHKVTLNNLKPGTTYYYEIETQAGKDRMKGSFQTK